MPDLNTNATNRIPSRKGNTTREAFSLNDFPTPSGGIITLNSGATIFKDNITNADRFLIADNQNVLLTSSDEFNVTYTYTGTDAAYATDILG